MKNWGSTQPIITASPAEDKFSTGLTDPQIERLAFLAEEMGETIQIIGKTLRHGINSYNPNDPDKITNKTFLEWEISDVLKGIHLLGMNGDIDLENIEENVEASVKRHNKYFHYEHVQ